MKTRLSLLLLCSTLFASFSSFAHYQHGWHDHPHPDYDALHNWTNKDGKTISAHFKDFDEDTKTLYIEHKGRKFNIPFDNLSEKSQKLVRQFIREEKQQAPQEPKPEPQFIPKDAAQKILLARIENLEQIVIALGEKIELLKKQGGVPRGQNWLQDSTNSFNAAQRDFELQQLQQQMETIKFNQMSAGPDLLIP